MIHIAVAMSLVGTLFVPGPPLATKDCWNNAFCPGVVVDNTDQSWQVRNGDEGGSTPRRRGNGGRPTGPPPTECEPRDPRPAKADITAMPIPEGELIHDAGDGPVVVGMDTEFRWVGPDTVTWTQPGRAGVREDCSLVPAEPTQFSASLAKVFFEFEQGEKTFYETTTGRVTHRYTTIPADEGEEQFTVCVYAGYELPGEIDFNALVLVEELDHDVVEIRSTLIE